MSAVGRKLFAGSKKVKKGPVAGGPKSDGEITPESPGSIGGGHAGRLSAGAGFTESDGMGRRSPIMIPTCDPMSHPSGSPKDTLAPPETEVAIRCKNLRIKRNSGSSSGDSSGVRPASIAVFNSPLMGRRPSKSSSTTSLNSDCIDTPIVNQEEIVQLTRDVRTFQEALTRLRGIFYQNEERTETVRVLAHERLRDLLNILRTILDKYSALRSTDVHTAAVLLITQIKGLTGDGDNEDDRKRFYEAIDQLALAFSSSVTEYLMGDVEQGSGSLPGFPTSKSYESLSSLATSNSESSAFRDMPADSRDTVTACLSAEELDDTLMQLDSGVDLALERAKVWSKYAKDVICYVEKRVHLETEFARNLAKLAATTRPTLKEESYLPFQSTYLTTLEHDIEYANNCETTYTHIQGHKFVEQLETRRNEHDKKRKGIRSVWSNIKKEMSECKSNMEKAKQLYYARSHEFEKARDSATKAEDGLSSSGASASSAKLEKKRKVEEDALLKAKEAETTYKACVIEANSKQQEVVKVKRNLLVQLRELVYQCDQTMRAVTVSYFQLQHSLSAPAPVQYQTLCEQTRSYEPGVQFSEFVRQYRSAGSSSRTSQRVTFTFEPYITGGMHRDRKPSGHSFDSLEEDKPSSPHHKSVSMKASNSLEDRDNKFRIPVHAWGTQPGVSDSDSMSSSSTKSMDHSPSASPMNGHRNLAREVSSGDELGGGEEQEAPVDTGDAKLMEPVPSSFKNLNFSKAAQTHVIRKLRTPSKCRECDSYVYFNGAECERCGLACHKKCLETLAIQCGGKRLMGKMNVFGVNLRDHLRATGKEVPFIVTKCVSEIQRRALHTKGIYRVAGLKVKVEKLCQTFENGQDLVDISEIQPHLVTSVLKLYLRQLPEPLLTYELYSDFITIAKEFPGGEELDKADEERLQERLQEIIDKLPMENWKVASVLMHHLKRVSDAHENNKMSSSNLGIIFGPTLLKPLDNSASLSALVDMQHQTRIIELLIIHAEVLGGVIGGGVETPVEDFQPDMLETSPGDGSYLKGDRPSKSYLDDTSMPGFLLPGSSEDNEDVSRTGSGRSRIEDLQEEREERTSGSEDEVEDTGGGDHADSDPDSPNPESPIMHRLRRQRVKRGGNYGKDRNKTANIPSSPGDGRSHSDPDILGSSPPSQDSDFQGYVPSCVQQQPQKKAVGITHSLPISNPATSPMATRNRNVLPPTEEVEADAMESSASGVVRSRSTKTVREPRFV